MTKMENNKKEIKYMNTKKTTYYQESSITASFNKQQSYDLETSYMNI